MKVYKEFRFRKMSTARKKQRQMKRKFGYIPEIFQATNPDTGKREFFIVKPHGVEKV